MPETVELRTIEVTGGGYILSMYSALRRDALAWQQTGECPRCLRGDDRIDERHSDSLHEILDGITLHCVICGREVTANA